MMQNSVDVYMKPSSPIKQSVAKAYRPYSHILNDDQLISLNAINISIYESDDKTNSSNTITKSETLSYDEKISMIIHESGITRELAIKLLEEANNDIVHAILLSSQYN